MTERDDSDAGPPAAAGGSAASAPDGGEDRIRYRDWPRWARRIVTTLVRVLVLLVALAIAGFVVARHSLPQTDGELTLRGLDSPVRVLRDDHGIPQLYADSAHDLFYAQGFVQAQDRFWQMDLRRHETAGRLSELFGKRTLASDLLIRTMGWRRVAAQEYDLLDQSTRDYLQAYSDGVNAWLAGRSTTQTSLEYTLLGLSGLDYSPEKWTPVDSLAWLKAMAWDLRGNMQDEIARTRLGVGLSASQVADLYPSYPYRDHAPIVTTAATASTAATAGTAGTAATAGTGVSGAPRASRAVVDPAREQQALAALERTTRTIPDLVGSGPGVGSNSWVVSGRRTDTGKPLLANDPHLAATQPGVWYQMGLHCTRVDSACPFDVSGFTFAGVPGVLIGHDRDVAWGMTNLDPDVSDLFLEKVRGHGYETDGAQLPLTERDERVRVRGEPTTVFTVRSTRHGPLVSDVSRELSSVGANASVPGGSPPRGNGYAVALQWTALTPRPTADAIFMLDRATDFADFREAARRFAVPSQNLVYADTAGNIGYQAPGAIPVRAPNVTGDLPTPGWLSADDWRGEIPFDQLPHELNPPEGFIVAANQAVVGPSYDHYLGDSYDAGFRSERIRTLIEERLHEGRVDLRDMLGIQRDDVNPIAPELVPLLLQRDLGTRYYRGGQRLLRGWDYRQPAHSSAAAYFNAVWRNLLELTFGDQVPRELMPDGGDRWVLLMSRLLRTPDDPWWDDVHTRGTIEDRDTILTEAMKRARDELTRRLSVHPEQWQWGHLHQLGFDPDSPVAEGFGPVEALFDRGPWPLSGGSAAVEATSWDAAEGYRMTTGPSMRMVVDLADLDRSRWIDLSGESGHAMSPHYVDQTRLWLTGATLPWASSSGAVRRQAADTLVLQPR